MKFQNNVSTEDKVSELSEEDVAVSYMGDELDLKTMGDIIAIIEDKVRDRGRVPRFPATPESHN